MIQQRIRHDGAHIDLPPIRHDPQRETPTTTEALPHPPLLLDHSTNTCRYSSEPCHARSPPGLLLTPPRLGLRSCACRVRRAPPMNLQRSPIRGAYVYRLYSVCGSLLAGREDWNDPNDDGDSPLIHAARVGGSNSAPRMVQCQTLDLGFMTKATHGDRVIDRGQGGYSELPRRWWCGRTESRDTNGQRPLNRILRTRNHFMMREVIRTGSSTHLLTE